MSIQDFCNLLGGGLVSLSTIHPDTVAVISSMSAGAVICVYKYNPADVIERAKEDVAEEEVYETPVIFADIPAKKSKKQVAKEAAKAAEAAAIEAAKDESGAIPATSI